MRLATGDIEWFEMIIVTAVPVCIALLAFAVIKPLRRALARPSVLQPLHRVHAARWWLRAVAVLFVPLWIFAGHYDVGWRTSNNDYLMLTRGLFYVIFRGGYLGWGPWWERDMVWTFREQTGGPCAWLGFDGSTDGYGFGVPLWYPGLLLTLLSVAPAILTYVAKLRQFSKGCCQECGYSTVGLTKGTCPECGKVAEPN